MSYSIYDAFQLFGSLGLFLYGMMVMSDALLDLAGGRMRSILATMTSNRFYGILTGFTITSVIQSSSATTLMVVSFANASLLTLTEAISVIMGANIGTTITAWLITILGFKVNMSAIALPLVGFGLAFTFIKRETLKKWGTFIIGFAILFIGLQLLKDAVPDIKSNPEMLEFLKRYTDLGYWSVLIFLLIGTLLTVIIQSSSATMALTLIMTAQGWIPFELAAAMVLGENIGTTITANIAAIVGNHNAKRTARAHLFFNILGVIWVLALFYPFLRLVTKVVALTGSDSPYVSAAAIPVAISLFHTIFNICNTLLLVWFVKFIARIVERLVPAKEVPEIEVDQPRFLDKEVMKYPETLIASLEKESKALFKGPVFEVVAHSMNLHTTDIKSEEGLKKVMKRSTEDLGVDPGEAYERRVKQIYGAIIKYGTKAQSKFKLSEAQHAYIADLKLANRKMVEILRNMREVRGSIIKYKDTNNTHLLDEYDRYRKKLAKVLRTIYRFRKGEELKSVYHEKLLQLREEARQEIHTSNKRIDKLIRKNLVDENMASSLVNDNDNVNDAIKKLITVADLLYGEKDPALEVE